MQKLYLLAITLLSAGAALAQSEPAPQLPQRKVATTSMVPNSNFRADLKSRIDSDLQQLYQRSRSASSVKQLQAEFSALTVGPLQTTGTAQRSTSSAPAVLVRITAKDVEALLPQLKARDFQVVSSFPMLHFVEGYLPISELAPGVKVQCDVTGVSAHIEVA